MESIKKAYAEAGLLVILILFACTDARFYDQNQSIPAKTWRYDYKPAFQVDIQDIDSLYTVYLHVRHTNDYPYSNLFVLLYETAPDGSRHTYRVEIPLAERDGRWLGQGIGSVFSRQVKVLRHHRFKQKGTYTYTLEQNMRANPLMEITDIGIAVQPIPR